MPKYGVYMPKKRSTLKEFHKTFLAFKMPKRGGLNAQKKRFKRPNFVVYNAEIGV